jgi:di/tricarboxylate transporter
MFVPFLVPLCQQMGGNISTMFMLVFIALNASYVTPAASFQSAMVHGLDRMSTKWAYILGTAFLIITWIVLFTVGMPVCNALFA